LGEFQRKMNAILALLERSRLDAIWLRKTSSFAWATCGAASYINTAASDGAASLLVTPSKHFLISDNIEAPRMEREERLCTQGWNFQISAWHAGQEQVERLTRGLMLGVDGCFPGARDLSAELSRMRSELSPEEGERFHELARSCSEAVQSAALAVRPGMSEFEIASLLSMEAQKRGALPIINLVATDERVFRYRHPLPTPKKLDRYALLVLCGRRFGLVCSLTRLLYFGRLPDQLRQKAEAVAQVDAVFIGRTRAGRSLGDIFTDGMAAYRRTGFADEWRLHHQGGPAGYEPREFLATPESTEQVLNGQVYAWNPSITGVKSEDTILVEPEGNRILTTMPDWPMTAVNVNGIEIPRPSILEIA
jgi:Xaa-Pro aminopeptidase